MAQYEEKFIVVNKKHLINSGIQAGKNFLDALNKLNLPENYYYVCNQDEPYAQKVIDIILEGEEEKEYQESCPDIKYYTIAILLGLIIIGVTFLCCFSDSILP